MKREKITARLIVLRESKLREEVAELKRLGNLLERIEQTRAGAAGATRESAVHLRDIGLYGEIRLNCMIFGKEVYQQVSAVGQRVTQAWKLSESARATHKGIIRKKLAAQEVSVEGDADHFLGWKRTGGR